MIVEKGLEQGFWAFFQFFDNLGNRATAPVQFVESAGKGVDTGRRKFVYM